MTVGLIVQTIAQTAAVLLAFGVGLLWHLEAGAALAGNPLTYILQHDWRGVDVQSAETMAFVTLSLCELFRAYTVRSERASLFSIGVFSNRYMQYAVGLSIFLLLLVLNEIDSPRFNVDVDEFGSRTRFGTIRRNIPEEIKALQAGLSPGQVHRGLRISFKAIPLFEKFIARTGHDMVIIERSPE